jgi:hypothetical protein
VEAHARSLCGRPSQVLWDRESEQVGDIHRSAGGGARGSRCGAALLACGLDELAAENYCSFLGRQVAAKTWSDQQLAFLGMLFHRATLVMSGRILLAANLNEKTIGREKPERKASCRDDMHARVAAGIKTYVAEFPPPSGCARELPYLYCEAPARN